MSKRTVRQEDVDYVKNMSLSENDQEKSNRLKEIAASMAASIEILNTINNYEMLECKPNNYEMLECKPKNGEPELDFVWTGQLMYKHKAFTQPRFIDLGFVATSTQDAAVEECKKRAKRMLEAEFTNDDTEKHLECWEVRARPVQIPKN